MEAKGELLRLSGLHSGKMTGILACGRGLLLHLPEECGILPVTVRHMRQAYENEGKSMRIEDIDKNLKVETNIRRDDLVWLNVREAPPEADTANPEPHRSTIGED